MTALRDRRSFCIASIQDAVSLSASRSGAISIRSGLFWKGALVVMDIVHRDDVQRAVQGGADAVKVWNHGVNNGLHAELERFIGEG